MSLDISGFKQGQKAMWTAGDYPEVARRIVKVGEYLAERAGAARGIELLDAQRERAAAEGVEVELVEGDAEALPFDADSFDRVTSCFGVMFAPQQKVAADELVRVARPGGTIVVAAWTPDGFVGRNFRVTSRFMPAPPPELKPPVMWGEEDHVRGLFADAGAELAFERRAVPFTGDSAAAFLAQDEEKLGPAVMAKAALEPQGRWEDLRQEMLAMFEDANEADDGSFRVDSEYLVTVAHLPG